MVMTNSLKYATRIVNGLTCSAAVWFTLGALHLCNNAVFAVVYNSTGNSTGELSLSWYLKYNTALISFVVCISRAQLSLFDLGSSSLATCRLSSGWYGWIRRGLVFIMIRIEATCTTGTAGSTVSTA